MKVFKVIFDLDDEMLKTYAMCNFVLTTDADKAVQFIKEKYPNFQGYYTKILDVYEVTDEGIFRP